MGKFTGAGTRGGQLSALERLAQPELPTGTPVEGEVAAAPTVEQPSVAPSAPPAAPTVPEVAEVGPAEGTVPTITERGRQQVAPVKWNPKLGPPVISDDGGIQHRAEKVASTFQNNSAWEGGLAISPGQETTGLSAALSNVGAIVNQDKVQKPDGSAGFQTQIDPVFLMIGSAVTENVITRIAAGRTAVPDFQAEKKRAEGDEAVAESTKGEITKSQANIEIGQEAHREYNRVKNAQQDRATDDYTDLSPEDASVLGDALKEMYAAANPDLFKAMPFEVGKQKRFQITPQGFEEINSPNSKLKRAVMFPGVNVRPSKTPVAELKTEAGRVATRRATGHVKGTPAGRQLIEQSTRNMSTIPNVVDPQRMKILFTTILPLLKGDSGNPIWAEINNIGESQAKKFAAEAKKKAREGEVYDPTKQMENLIKNVANSVRAVAQERKGANYLTYYIQNFNGRTAPQQSFFDPTTSKAVRFVTRNAVPAKATPGSRVNRNLRQMYAMMLVKDADARLPEERERMLQRATPQLVAWGKLLQQKLEETMTNEQMEQIASQIEAGAPLTDMQIPELRIEDGELMQAIKKKGEDGPHFIDGLIDFAKYHEANQAGRPYYSYFNAYMDGKTNGIASNGIQMGSEEVAFKTGVMRTQSELLLDDNIDIRDKLMKDLTEQLDTTGMATTDPNMYTVARKLFNYRQLAKDTTMTYGYGKEFESFKADIDGVIDLLAETDPEFAAAFEAAEATGDRETIVETLWKEYTNFLGGALSPEALEARPLMRAAATYFALMDTPFNITTATGFELNLGGEVATGEFGEGYTEQEYGIYEGGKKRKVTAQRYGTRSSAIAPKGDQGIGSRAYGGSLPGPVQSLDAAAIAMTTTGKSWQRLRENSDENPYFHHVYDAVKVDAMGYDVVLDEINKNWLDASMEWSYLQSTLNSLEQQTKDFNTELKEYPDELTINTGPTDEYAMFGHLTARTPSASSGKIGPWNLAKKMARISGEKDFIKNIEKANRILNKMEKEGFDVNNPKIKDFKLFMKLFAHEVNLKKRLTDMIEHTDNKKKKLKAKIKEAGLPVYQYYAH